MYDLKHDIEKYLRGELSPSEMHALEKKALSDSFLADALAGGESINYFSDDLQLLERSLQRRIQSKGKTVSLLIITMRIAAGLLILFVTAYIIYNFSREEPNNQLALNKPAAGEQQEERKDERITDPDLTKQQPSTLRNDKAKSKLTVSPITSENDNEAGSVSAPQAELSEPELIVQGDVTSEDDIMPMKEREEAHEEILTNEKPLQAEPKELKIERASKKTEIVNPQAAPGKSYSGASDVSKEIVEIEFMPVNQQYSNDGFKYTSSQPVGGNEAFKNYISRNKHYPKEALENKIAGDVTIQFIVKPNGSLDDFNVLKGIGFGCDEETIRLIKDGTQWTPAKRNGVATEQQVVVKLKFVLPD